MISLVKIGSVVLEKIIFELIFVNEFSLCGYYPALEKSVALHLNKVESP